MKPAFALTFSETGISLHHQSDGDWYCIGSVPLESADLNAEVRALRDRGFAIENHLACTLLLPQQQIRFLTVDTGELTDEEARQKVRETLETATPYALEELAYSTIADGDEVQVAAVTRKTLDEAKTFATGHGFIPQSFGVNATNEDSPTGQIFEFDLEQAAPETLDEATEEPEEPAHHPDLVATAQRVLGQVSGTATAWAAQFDLKRHGLPVAVASVALGVALGAWSLVRTDSADVDPPSIPPQIATPGTADFEAGPSAENVALAPQASEAPATPVSPIEPSRLEPPELALSEPEVADEPVPTQSPPDLETADAVTEEAQSGTTTGTPALSATDAAILEALQTPPETVQQVAPADAPQAPILEFTGALPVAPSPLIEPVIEPETEFYYSSVAQPVMSFDAVALPALDSLETDKPFDQAELPSQQGQRFVLDERGLVTPSAEGTLNPGGVMVFAGPPQKVPPRPPVRFEAEPEAPEADQRLASYRPRVRPVDLPERFERQQYGGRLRDELAALRPKVRPAGLQPPPPPPTVDETPELVATISVPRPKSRPSNIAIQVAQRPAASGASLGSTANVNNDTDEAGSVAPRSVTPKIPTTASVARQATIDNAINLRQLNLIGVYGTPSNRRALVRLPSGRYKKLKVGDRLDGGNVVAIGESELRYQKRGRNLTLKIPSG
ncbi:hypothetical protein [Ruegeria sp. HKCCD7255]|uniref:hypothetical protein n=1 Tax=Ruegeria sp. HKCCD7255 TaxID=2683004 RepID=UPI00148A10BD|nr:hypothetical protein [Ruegeria sp. HKCCD7255]